MERLSRKYGGSNNTRQYRSIVNFSGENESFCEYSFVRKKFGRLDIDARDDICLTIQIQFTYSRRKARVWPPHTSLLNSQSSLLTLTSTPLSSPGYTVYYL